MSELASPFAAIYDTKAKNKVTDQPVGTGPYKIDQYKRSQKIVLKQFKDYWQGTPKLKELMSLIMKMVILVLITYYQANQI